MIVMRQPCLSYDFNFLTDVLKLFHRCAKAF